MNSYKSKVYNPKKKVYNPTTLNKHKKREIWKYTFFNNQKKK